MLAEIIYTRAGDLIIKAPFQSGFINELKAIVPRKFRTWEPDSKQWFVDGMFDYEMNQLVNYYFPDNITIDLARAAMATRAPEAPQWAKTLYIQPNAPKEVKETVYRALSKKYHPDLGGSEQLMKILNNAIEQARG